MSVNTLPVFDIGATEPSHSMTYGVKHRTTAECLDSPRTGKFIIHPIIGSAFEITGTCLVHHRERKDTR